MRSADKVILVDTMNGADLGTRSATCAKRVVVGCKIIFNLNGIARASLLAFHASDTSVDTKLTGNGTLIMI